jgi:hypothetical protein
MPNTKSLGAFLLLFLLGLGTPQADPVALNPQHPERYVVVRGDTLWDISSRFLRDPWLWPEVWHVNPQIANPHLIYPGDTIRLVYIDGQPRLVLERGTQLVQLTPQIRVEGLDGAVPTIPIEVIRPYLTRNRVVGENELARAPYVVESVDERLITAAGDRVYVRGIDNSDHLRYGVFREGTTYRSPRTGEVLGLEAVYAGDGTLQRFGDPATLMLIATAREVLVGDRLLPLAERPVEPHFYPRPPGAEVEGSIISVFDGVSQIGQHHVVVLDLGERDGMEPGHVLAVYRAGKVVRDRVSTDRQATVRLPDERAGVLMVFRTFERVSYGLIMSATNAINVFDAVRNP